MVFVDNENPPEEAVNNHRLLDVFTFLMVVTISPFLISYFQLRLSPTLRPIFLTTDIGMVLLSDLRFELFKATVVISPSPCNPIVI
jgi:hypothetical protein